MDNSLYKETLSAGKYTQSKLLTLPSTLQISDVAFDPSGNLYIGYTNNDGSPASVLKLDYSSPPALSFATSAYGATSTDSPQTVTVENAGNAAFGCRF